MHAFILAGGFATRLWPLTEKRAKPLLPLAGKPIISHLVEKIPAEVPVTVSTNAAFADGFNAWKKTLGRSNVEVIVEDSKKDDHKLGALGATAKWISESNITDDVLLLTGDNYLGFSMKDFLAAYTAGTPLLAAFDIKDRAKASAFGTVILKEALPPSPGGRGGTEGGEGYSAQEQFRKNVAQVRSFEEKPLNSKTSIVSTGCSIIPASTLPVLLDFAKSHPDNVGGIFEEFLRKDITVECFTFTEPWLDIGSFPAYLEAHRLLVGATPLQDPTAHVENSTLEGSNSIAAHSKVIGSTLSDVMIFENCTIEDCVLRDCIIDENCVLKGIDLTGKMIRSGTRLEQ